MSHREPENLAARDLASSRRRRLRIVAVVIALGLLAGVAYLWVPWPGPPAASFTVVAHRSVHQTFPLTNLTNETCTAAIIDPPTHAFLENTLPSMQAAFAAGADAVEIDIHRTADGQLVVFHDWAVDCRTEGSGVTNQQTLADLQRLDVGDGYTADGGAAHPLRGQGVGLMPSLPEVLAAFPDAHFVLDDKDGDIATRALLGDELASLPPDDQARLSYWGPGYPEIRARAHQAGVPVSITDVDTPQQLDAVLGLPIDGIQTNRIEVIGPLVAERRTGDTPAP